MGLVRLADIDVRGRRVFIRSDLNVPQDDAGAISDDSRIRASVPGIRDALARGAAVMVTSHLGRPGEGAWTAADSLAPVGRRLSELLATPVPLVKDWVDGGAWHEALKPGQVVLLENCRFNKGEKADDDALARKMAKLCDVYVNDAFGTAHRAEATTHGLAKYAPVACAGPLLAAELDALGKALAHPARPLVAIVGGSEALAGEALACLIDASGMRVLGSYASVEQLESALANYAGTLLLVTHDRALLDDITLTRRIELVDGRVTSDLPVG